MLSSLLVQDLFLPLFSFFLFSSFIVRLLSLLAYKCTVYTWLDCGSQKDEICYLQVPEREEELEFSVSVRQDNLLGPEGKRWGGDPCRDYLRTAFLQRLQAWRMTRLCLMVLRLAPSCLSVRVRPGDLLLLTSLAMDDITQVEDPTRPYSSNSFPLHRNV